MAEKKRITCRDEEGKARLMPGMTVMTAVEALCRLEERYMGVLTVPARTQPEMLRCRDCRNYRMRAFNSGTCTVRTAVVCGVRKACETFDPVGAGDEGDGSFGSGCASAQDDRDGG